MGKICTIPEKAKRSALLLSFSVLMLLMFSPLRKSMWRSKTGWAFAAAYLIAAFFLFWDALTCVGMLCDLPAMNVFWPAGLAYYPVANFLFGYDPDPFSEWRLIVLSVLTNAILYYCVGYVIERFTARFCAIAGVLIVGALIAQVLNPPFTLTISPARSPVKVGDRVEIQIAIKNISGRPMPFTQIEPDMDYDVTVWKSDGTPPPDTERGRAIRDKSRRSHFTVMHQVVGELEPDPEAFVEPNGIDIADLYDLRDPGQYTVQVRRDIPPGFGWGAVKSNKVTVTVTE